MKNTERPRALPITWLGLSIVLFGMLLVRQLVNFVAPKPSVTSAILREVGRWLVGAVLLTIVLLGEGLPLRSIGLRASHLVKSTFWALLLTGSASSIFGAAASPRTSSATPCSTLFPTSCRSCSVELSSPWLSFRPLEAPQPLTL